MAETIQNDDVRTAAESGDPVGDGRKSDVDQRPVKGTAPAHPGDAKVGEDRESGVIDRPE